MGVPAPDLQLTVTAPNGTVHDVTEYLTYVGANQEMTITQNFGRQGDTALLPLVFEHGASSFPVRVDPLSQIRLHDNHVGQTLFAGVVTNPGFCAQGVNLGEFDVTCTDYTFYADHALVRFPASGVTASDQIVVSLTQQAKCGISAARVADGGYVAPGPALPQWTLGYVALSSAWRTLATAMGQVTPYGWYVDDSRQLHFYDAETALHSGVTFTTTPTTAGSTTQGHILLDSTFLWEQDATSLVNRVLVQGAAQGIDFNLKGSPTDEWKSDGVNTSWPLRYTVTSSPHDPVLYVGGVLTTLSAVNSGEAPTGPWCVISNSNGGFFLVAASAPPAGTSIRIWYCYEAPIIMQAQDAQSIATYTGPNSGVFSEFISDSSLTTPPMALARAQQDRAEYAFPVQRITFNTSPEFLGWVRAGYVFTLDCGLIQDPERGYAMGVNDAFLCTANQVTFADGGYRTCQITGVRL